MQVGRFLGRAALILGGMVGVAVIAASVGLAWAWWNVKSHRLPLPTPEEIVGGTPDGAMPTRVSWINTASQFVPRSAVLDPAGDPDAGAWSRMSFPAFVIEWADGRILLVDAGMDAEGARAFGVPIEYAVGADPIEPLTDVATALGPARDRVAGIVFTHLHDDHTEGVQALCRASAKPIEALLSAAQADAPTYLTRSGLRAVETAPCLQVRTLGGDAMTDLPGFPGVRTIAVAGHTPGSQLVVVRLGSRGAHPIVLTGDVVNSDDGIERDVPKPRLYRLLVVPEDDERLGEVRRLLRTLAHDFGATPLVSHDQASLETSGVAAFGAPRP